MKKVLLSILLTLLPLLASAEAVEIDGIWYNLIPKGNAAEVVRNPNQYSGEIVIPETVIYEGTKYNVTKIAGGAFFDCKELKSLKIPKTINCIGEGACYNYGYQIISVFIDDLEAWCEIDFEGSLYSAFSCFDLYINNVVVIDLNIPNTITTIKRRAFMNCRNIQSVNIPNSVTSIGESAFQGCSNLTSITIPNSVTSIGEYAFTGCESLSSITIPNSVTSIGEYAFASCESLSSITISSNLTSISEKTFSSCSNLTSITIPNSVTSIGDYAFSSCSGLTSVTIPNSVTSIGVETFQNCSSLTIVTIGSGIESIRSRTFALCPELTDVYCYAINAPNTYIDAFKDSYTKFATLHVPAESVDTYKAADPWKNFKEIIPLGNYYDFTINVGNNGKVEYNSQAITGNSNTFYVEEGANAELTITPDENYQIATLTVNGVDAKAQLNNGILTISNITANTTVTVTFEAISGLFETIRMAVASGDRTAIGYSSANGLDFTNVTDVKAWIVSGFTANATVLLSRVKIVPPNTGLYLTSDVAGVEVVVPKTDLDVFYANLLLAAVNEETIDPTEVRNGVEYTNFVVGKLNSGEMGFVRVKNTRTLGPNKSRLLVPSSYYPVSNQAPELQVTFSEDASTTDLRSIDVTQPSDSHVFDLQGRKLSVDQAQKGIYIYKGKKYVIK